MGYTVCFYPESQVPDGIGTEPVRVEPFLYELSGTSESLFPEVRLSWWYRLPETAVLLGVQAKVTHDMAVFERESRQGRISYRVDRIPAGMVQEYYSASDKPQITVYWPADGPIASWGDVLEHGVCSYRPSLAVKSI
jgi:hypothetical protein